MNFKFFISSMMLAAVAFLLPGCSDDDSVIDEKVPSLDLKSEVVEATAEGGEYSVGYTITNPVSGGSLAPSCDAEWITLSSATDGKIAFTVAANETTTAREAVVEVSYTNIETPKTFTVKQAAANEKPTPEPEIKLDATEVNVSSEGGAAEMAYTLTNPVEGATLKATTKAEWITDLNTDVAGKITFTVAANETTTAREAVVEVSYANIKTPKTFTVKQAAANEKPTPEPEIKLNATEVNVSSEGGAAEMAYTLTNPVEGAALKATTKAEWITDLNTDVAGKITFTVAANEQTAPRTAEIEITYPQIKDPIRFTVNQEAANAPQPQGEILIEISNITDKSAYLKFTPSNNITYAAGLMPSYKLTGKTTDEEILSFIINEFGPNSFENTFEAEIRPLESDTEYYVFAFGYNASKKEATTKLYHKTFNTLVENNEVSDIKIVLEYGEYADAQSVGAIDADYGAAIDPSKSALVPFNVYTIPEGHKVFWYILDPSALESLSKDSLIETLINGGGLRSSKTLQLDYGTTFVGLAVAEDEQGRHGELFIGEELTLTPEGVMPAEEFVKKYPLSKSTKQILKKHSVKKLAPTASQMLLGR